MAPLRCSADRLMLPSIAIAWRETVWLLSIGWLMTRFSAADLMASTLGNLKKDVVEYWSRGGLDGEDGGRRMVDVVLVGRRWRTAGLSRRRVGRQHSVTVSGEL
nr:hypothetical protein Iba_chr04bCG15960 [Ipomoea batatas]